MTEKEYDSLILSSYPLEQLLKEQSLRYSNKLGSLSKWSDDVLEYVISNYEELNNNRENILKSILTS